ncbi:NAD(P)H-binding protein [Nostocoides sp. F2B08]|uniref:SDR family oxidoreductase n=1 Tax=Nostocoides sp. F2B08 TaxID=2653936 RepID=UPI001262C8DB|nr:NAD(P)H-binding protein [Tetrasphaera sp. F2B08]KAB7745215.1 NAD(P)H-binding protein [Tetrasphaera sp. F2B08]
MKVVVLGGSGLIGSRLVAQLATRGHQVVSASRATGVDVVTGAGLAEVLAGADSVVDVTNAPPSSADDIADFFRTATANVLAAEATAGVAHHVTLSVVGADRVHDSGYFRGKAVQERLVQTSGRPHTIVRSTQFFEFLHVIADSATSGHEVRLSPVLFQPVAAADLVEVLERVATGAPTNGVVEVAGPEQVPIADLVTRALARAADPRVVLADPHATYFDAELREGQLLPGPEAVITTTTFDHWVTTSGDWRASSSGA